MAKRRRSIPLQPHEDALLRKMYRLWRIPTDQFDKRPDRKTAFVLAWNRRSGRRDEEGEVMHYMKTKRKNRQWETFNGNHERFSMSGYEFTDEDLAAAEEIYVRLTASAGVASDAIGYDQSLSDKLAAEFAQMTGRILPGSVILSALVGKRKRGELPKSGRQRPKIGFGDIDEVAE